MRQESINPRPILPKQFQQTLKFIQPLDLSAGEIVLRVGVHDVVSHTVGTLEIPLAVARMLARPAAQEEGTGGS